MPNPLIKWAKRNTHSCVLADVERLLRQLRGSMGINGQCTVSNLKKVLMQQGLCSSGPKPELVQRVYNYMHLIRERHGLPAEEAEILLPRPMSPLLPFQMAHPARTATAQVLILIHRSPLMCHL